MTPAMQEMPSPAFAPAARIIAILPDDGTDRRLLEGLRSDCGVTRADSVRVREVAVLQEATASRGKLPEPSLARMLSILVAATEAESVFAYVCRTAHIGRPGGGTVMLERIAGATPYELPSEDDRVND